MASAYCTAADVYAIAGIQRGALPNPGRVVESVSTGANTLTLGGHGYGADAALLFRAEDGGSLPAPLAEGTTYYAIPLTDDTFSVSASAGGAAVNITTEGSRIVVSGQLPVTEAIEAASAEIDDMMPAHVVPFETVPATVKRICADLAAARLLLATGAWSELWQRREELARKQLERFARHVPIRGAVVPPSASLAVVGVVSGTDPRGWAPTGGTLP